MDDHDKPLAERMSSSSTPAAVTTTRRARGESQDLYTRQRVPGETDGHGGHGVSLHGFVYWGCVGWQGGPSGRSWLWEADE